MLIQFINGDIDRPIVTGSVYNGTHRPVAFSDAGNLPGIKSKMHKSRGLNEVVWDDTTNEQRICTATDHGKTALNQGYLVHPRREGKGEPRGEGFELRTDQYGAKDIKVTSVDGNIDITASKSIRLTAGRCQIEVGNGQITLKAPRPVNIHGSVKNLTGPAFITPDLPQLPKIPLPVDLDKPLFSQQFDLSHLAHYLQRRSCGRVRLQESGN